MATSNLSEVVLAAENVGVQFGGKRALDAVSFAVQRGDIVAVVGPNGAGKTTLLNAISGLLARGLIGDIKLQGHAIARKRPATISKLGLGRSFQDPPLVDDLSVFDNVMTGSHGALRYGMATQWCRRRHVHEEEARLGSRVEQILDICGLSDYGAQRAGSLAYGQRKLIDIARALVPEPQILLLDEPTSGVDPSERHAIKNLIVELNRSHNTAIVLIEHHIELVTEVATKVLGLQAGRVIAFGEAKAVLASAAFRAALIGKELDQTHDPAQGLTVGGIGNG